MRILESEYFSNGKYNYLSTPLIQLLCNSSINQLKMTTLNGYNVFHVHHQFEHSPFLVNCLRFN